MPHVTSYLLLTVKATGGKHGTHMKPTRAHLKMHNHSSAVPVGKVMLGVERGNKKHYLHIFIMKLKVMSILGKSSCVGMKLVKILTVHPVDTGTKANTSGLLSTEQMMNDPILSQYIDVFNGLGALPGEYTIQVKPDVVPVINPPRRLPVALRNIVKAEVDTMVDEQIIEPVRPGKINLHFIVTARMEF